MITPTIESLEVVRRISDRIGNQTFHHHFHILYDLPLPNLHRPTYLEIGCYAGASAILMLQKDWMHAVSIDVGAPIPQSVVEANVEANNPNKNTFCYVLGDSHQKETFERVSDLSVDVLFIDGDHTGNGVKQDWEMYSQLVVPGGWIVFDDYNDEKYSPDVKQAVNDISEALNPSAFRVYGTLPNTLGARGFPPSFTDGNCFVVQKLFESDR